MKIYAGRDFLGRAYMCPSLGTEDRVMRYQVLTGSPGGPALGWPVMLGICTIQTEGEFGYCAPAPRVNSALVANHRSTSGAVIGVDTDANSAIPRRNVPNAYAQGALASGAAREIRKWWRRI